MELKFLKDLRQLRLDKNISLQDIAGATRINVRFLEAIEQGDFDILPEPYVKSILNQYAKYIGFDHNELIAHYDEYKESSREGGDENTVRKKKNKTAREPINTPKLKMVFLSLALIGLIALLVYLFLTYLGATDEPVVERPFLDVVREVEEEAEQNAIEPIDTPAAEPFEQPDSVSLIVTALDSVWLTITVDNLIQEEFIFPPGRNREWTAANEFLLTVGNAGGVSIVVDGDTIGVLGSPGQVMRNLHITRDGIRR